MGERPNSKKWRLWICGTALALILLGYLSAWISLPACQAHTARWLMSAMPPNRQFVIHRQDADARRLAVWDQVDAYYRVRDPGPVMDGAEYLPWCRFGESRVRLPFLSSVEYGWVAAPLVGDGGNLWFLCFFGLTFKVGRSISWMT
jgi:hypothetical protein